MGIALPGLTPPPSLHSQTQIQKSLYYTVATTSHFEPDTPHPSLSTTITTRCASLQEHLIAHFTPILFTVPTAGHMACTDVFAETWMGSVIAPVLESSGLCRPVETLKMVSALRWEDMGVCEECCVEKRKEWEEEIWEVWHKVDGWLGL